jgi:hypothetical protein
MMPPNVLKVSRCDTGDNPVDEICDKEMNNASMNDNLTPGFCDIGNHNKKPPTKMVIKYMVNIDRAGVTKKNRLMRFENDI